MRLELSMAGSDTADGDALGGALMVVTELRSELDAESYVARTHLRASVDLVSQAQGGSRASFEELYRRFGPTVHGILLSRVPPTAADDLTQEVFLQAWHGLGSLREPAAFPGWIAQLARRRAADHHRRAGRTRALQSAAEAAAEVESARGQARTDAEPGAGALAVVDLIQSLPTPYVEPLMLRLVEGLSGPEIAARTGLTHGSVRVNLTRGYALLRARVEEARR